MITFQQEQGVVKLGKKKDTEKDFFSILEEDTQKKKEKPAKIKKIKPVKSYVPPEELFNTDTIAKDSKEFGKKFEKAAEKSDEGAYNEVKGILGGKQKDDKTHYNTMFSMHRDGLRGLSIQEYFDVKTNQLPDEDTLNNYILTLKGYLEVDKKLGDTLLEGSKNACSKATEDWDYLPESWLTTEYLTSIGINADDLKELGEAFDDTDLYLKILDKDGEVIGYAFTKNETLTNFIKGLEHFLENQLEEKYEEDPYKIKVDEGKADCESLGKSNALTSIEARAYVEKDELI